MFDAFELFYLILSSLFLVVSMKQGSRWYSEDQALLSLYGQAGDEVPTLIICVARRVLSSPSRV